MRLIEFVQSLRLERLTRRVKQADLAAHLSVNQGTVYRWESGRSLPTDERLQAWAAVLDIPVPRVVSGTPRPRIAECGSPHGRQRHRRRGEPVCDPCRRAYNRYHGRFRKSMRAGPP